MARVYDGHGHELYMHFANVNYASRFEMGSTFVVKGFVNILQSGLMKISAKLEDIEEPVSKDNNVPDIRNTISKLKKARIA